MPPLNVQCGIVRSECIHCGIRVKLMPVADQLRPFYLWRNHYTDRPPTCPGPLTKEAMMSRYQRKEPQHGAS